MAAVTFECSVLEDVRLRALPDALRLAFPLLVARIQTYGDGRLSDLELQVGLLEPELFRKFADALIGWGWLRRDAAGSLRRSGALAPVSEDALRMRARRGQGANRPRHGVNEERAECEQKPNRNRTFAEHLPNSDRTTSEHLPNTNTPSSEHEAYSLTRGRVTRASESESESESDSDSDSDSELTEGSDQIRSDQNPIVNRERTDSERRPLPLSFRDDADNSAPSSPLFDELRRDGHPERLLALAARRVGEHNLWKANYVRRVVANLVAEDERGETRPTNSARAAPLPSFDALLGKT